MKMTVSRSAVIIIDIVRRGGLRRHSYILSAVIALLLLLPTVVTATDRVVPEVELLSPKPGTEVIAKRPEIVCRALSLATFENVLVLLDGVDVTGIINTTPEGFSFVPVEILRPGDHTLSVMMTGAEGNPLQVDFTFSTRHSGMFEEAGTTNNLSLGWEKTVDKTDEVTFQNSYKMESNLGHDSVVREKAWEMRFTTNLRHLTQHLPAVPPQEKGINPANYLFSGTYQGQSFQARTQVGDVMVTETANTVNLSRRGGTIETNYKNLRLKTFMVNSEAVFGFKKGLGIGGSSDDHIVGASGEIGLLSEKVKLKTIYASGGEKGDGYSTYCAGGDKRGNVLGILLTSDFFNNKLTTEAELDLSHYDADTTDAFSREKDKAWKLGAGGLWNTCSYGIFYEHLGADYQVISSPYVQANMEGGGANFSASFPTQNVSFAFTRYRDNVDNDDLYARTVATQGQAQYMLNKFPRLPLGISYQFSEVKSQDEPEYAYPVDNTTNAISATVNYILGGWNFGAQAGFSDQNDATAYNADTEAVNYMLSSSYGGQRISFAPSLSFNRTRNKPTHVRMDTYTTTLDLRGNLWDERIHYETAGTFSRSESSDDVSKQDSYNINFRLTYTLQRKIWGINNPSMGVSGYYTATEDYVYNNRNHEFTLLFVFSAGMPFAY